ncbi:MAG: YegS/Rv2252/BmrU family lipid kinase [Tetrasphaera sp.]
MSHRLGVAVNPIAGRGRCAQLAPDLLAMLAGRGHEIHDLSGTDAVDTLSRARAAVHDGHLDALVVVGGDGMAHLGVNACAGTAVPFAVVPAGTGNDIAAALGYLPANLLQAVAAIEALGTRTVDAGRLCGDTPADERPWFAGSLYAGFDAIVNARANRWSWPRGQMRYNLAILRELPVFRPIPYAIEVDAERVETEAMLVVIANAASYGGGMQVAPDARIDDGLLDVVIVHRISRAEFLRVFPRVFTGAHIEHPAVSVLRGTRVRLEARGVPVFADGEPFTDLPVACEVVPGALTVVAP